MSKIKQRAYQNFKLGKDRLVKCEVWNIYVVMYVVIFRVDISIILLINPAIGYLVQINKVSYLKRDFNGHMLHYYWDGQSD